MGGGGGGARARSSLLTRRPRRHLLTADVAAALPITHTTDRGMTIANWNDALDHLLAADAAGAWCRQQCFSESLEETIAQWAIPLRRSLAGQ